MIIDLENNQISILRKNTKRPVLLIDTKIPDSTTFRIPHGFGKIHTNLIILNMTSRKFVAVLNKKIETGKVMNALAHMTVGLTNSYPDQDMGVINYKDKDGGAHMASKFPYIILRADNSNKIRTLRNGLIEKRIPFASFTSAMTVGSWEEQVAASESTPEAELEYYGICMLGERSDLDELTKKFSLWI